MTADELKAHTRAYGLRVSHLVDVLPQRRSADVMGRQLLRCATSVGANYRAACRARSRAEFVAKLGIVEEEADESLYWMELMAEAGLVESAHGTELIQEGNELLSTAVAAIKTARMKT
jgi:four helix bundle protein